MSTYANSQARLNRVAPQLRPAGVHGDWTEATTAELLSSYNPNGVTTPDHIRSFHHRGYDVGEQRRHWSLAKDASVDPNMRHGVKSKETGGADACLRPEMYADKMTALLDAQRETQYLSNRRKPLGHAPVPQDPVPVPFGGFGIVQKKGDSTQSVLAGYRSVDVLHPAGEQLTRNYDWEKSGIDPIQHRFGKPSASPNGSTASALCSDSATQLVSKLAKDYQTTVAKELGKSKSYGFDDPAEWDEKKRGRVTKLGATGTAASYFQTEQPTVRELISSWAQTVPGSGTGKAESGKANQQGLTTSADAGVGTNADVSAAAPAASGLPLTGTLKDDIHAHQLLYPCHYVSLGVESKYFAGDRPLEDIRRLSHKCGFGLSDASIDAVFTLVAKGGSACSIEEFKNAARANGYM
ncbi:conserved hypothetical protein [Leishmania braziliensis MHOM/BR/75/M2904]|uniref:EFHB C-terminal EF-hand domain-containing protein n=2 Tax=Leishmania braziliensis TaxID=5660 RepID=A4HPK0_LEIBR|nr:conserved hypothetical protein [Leishmania braziliensis MHOM/BR/75/M2904]KAI5691400.1 hypothetical protein MNV84_08113 [Leishmania braziliensis]CAJ2481652.1 unnamed protein product [Leishmania braziliensis]CAM44108.1 conserved hypothetical protein [Leishmania braziliensis MHOM/BR/75/M2904]SYZ70175.1 hypothetical_protein [Leishmania braziliensis MHOM/BR/75/M2904]